MTALSERGTPVLLLPPPSMKTNPNDGTQLSFTVDFHYSQGVPLCEGLALETVVSLGIGAKYRIGVRKTKDTWSTVPGLETPQRFGDVNALIDKRGPLCGDIFLFEVFDTDGQQLFQTVFDAKAKCPPDGYASDKLVCTSFTYLFALPEQLHSLAKEALARHAAPIGA